MQFIMVIDTYFYFNIKQGFGKGLPGYLQGMGKWDCITGKKRSSTAYEGNIQTRPSKYPCFLIECPSSIFDKGYFVFRFIVKFGKSYYSLDKNLKVTSFCQEINIAAKKAIFKLLWHFQWPFHTQG